MEIVQRLIEAWDRGDYAAALDSIDPDVEVNVAYQADFDGTYRGHAGLTEMLGAFWAEFEGQRIEIEEAVPVGGAVVAGVRFYGRGKRSGVEISAPAWHAWRLREGESNALAVVPDEARSTGSRRSVGIARVSTRAIGAGREEGDPELEGMLTADEVADVVLFTVTRPRSMRILTTSFRPMTEASWG